MNNLAATFLREDLTPHRRQFRCNALADDQTFDLKEEWGKLYSTPRDKFGSMDLYWTIFDSTQKDEPTQASLAGDISEIYSDMKHDLELAGQGVLNADLLWTLRRIF